MVESVLWPICVHGSLPVILFDKEHQEAAHSIGEHAQALTFTLDGQ